MSSNSVIRVMIVDDQPLVRVGMTTVVNQQADMKVTAEADNHARALAVFREQQPDVVLADLRLHGDNGTQLTRAMRAESPGARVLVISNYEGDENIRQALAAGAMGYVFKNVVEDELLDAIREIHAGRHYLPDGVPPDSTKQVGHPAFAKRIRDSRAAGQGAEQPRTRVGAGHFG